MDDYTYLSGTDRPLLDAPWRVGSLLPWASESLAELSLGDRLIAVTDDAVSPEGAFAAAERVGPVGAPDVARVIGLEPDLIIVGPDHDSVIEAAHDAAIPIWMADPQSVRDAFNHLWDWMNLFEVPQMVARVRALEWTCDWLERLAETRSLARIVVVAEPGSAWACSTRYSADLIRICGGDLCAPIGLLTEETISECGPEAILVDEALPDSMIKALTALRTPASRAGKVWPVDMRLLTWPGTRMARAFESLPNLISPTD